MTTQKNITAEIISGLFIILFLYASLSKLEDYEKFRIQLGKSPILYPFAIWVAWVVPVSEILISIGLFVKKTQLIALFASFTLMSIFSFYILAILKFSEYVPCSCGGILQNMTWSVHLVFNSFFIALAAFGVLAFRGKN